MRGTRTSSNQMRPLSTPLRPILGPQSSMRTPSSDPAALADRHDEGVHAVPLAADLELGEDDGQLGVRGRVADVVLAARVVGGRDDELLRRGVVRRDGAERLHVGAVAGLGHREAAHRAAGDEVGEVGVVVGLRAELEDRAAEEAELHADLDQHRQVAEGEGLEGGDRGADVAAAAVLLREAHAGLAGLGHLTTTSLTRSRKSARRHLLLVEEDLRVLGEVGAHQVADLGVAAVEQARSAATSTTGLAVARVVGVRARVVDLLDHGRLGLVGIASASRRRSGGPARWPWHPK